MQSLRNSGIATNIPMFIICTCIELYPNYTEMHISTLTTLHVIINQFVRSVILIPTLKPGHWSLSTADPDDPLTRIAIRSGCDPD